LSANTTRTINNAVNKEKNKLIRKKEDAQQGLEENSDEFIALEDQYANDLEKLEVYKTKIYQKALELQKEEMHRQKLDAIEKMGGFEEGTRTPKGALAAHLDGLRRQVDKWSEKIKELYPNDPDVAENLKAVIDNNLGIYITKSYKLFSEAGFIDKIMYDPNSQYFNRRKEAGRYFESQYKKERAKAIYKTDDSVVTINQAEELAKKELEGSPIEPTSGLSEITYGMMLEFLNAYSPNAEGWLSPEVDTKKIKPFAVVLSDKLKKRKNFPKAIRGILGEEQDATGYDALLKTYMHVAMMGAHHAFLKNLVDFGTDTHKEKSDSEEQNKWLVTFDELKKLRII